MRRLVSMLTTLLLATTVLLVTSPADAGSRYAVTAFASTAKLDVGQSFILKGKVRPKARGQKVKIQLLTGGHWTTIKKTRLNRRSKYKATLTVTAAGDNHYRVVKPRSSGHKKGISPVRTVVAWRWRSLLSMPHDTPTDAELTSPTSNAQVIPSVTFQELTFRPALKLGNASSMDPAWATFRLDGKCAKFDSHVGVTADSATSVDSFFDFSINPVGGDDSYSPAGGEQVIGRGDDPTHFYRGPALISGLDGIALFGEATEPGNFVAWGNPRVYCRS